MKKYLFILTFLILINSITNLYAYTDEEKLIDSNIYQDLAKTDLEASLPRPAFGGWFIPRYMQEKIDTKFDSYTLTTKIWLKAYLTNNIYIYGRIKHNYWKVMTKDEDDPLYTELEDSDNILDLDTAFISMRFFSDNLKIYLGRATYRLGSGLILNGRSDGAEINYYSSIADIKLLSTYTGLLKKDNNPYGLSSTDFDDGAKRYFLGGNIDINFLNQTIYLMQLTQIDKGDEIETAKSRYDSQYYGFGLKGILLTSLSYYGEYIIERGKSYDSNNEKQNIKASAFTSEIRYLVDVALKPTLLVNYAQGSGDSDRGSTTSATGNATGEDNRFIYFGTFNAGLALRPNLANIKIYRAGISLVPFDTLNAFWLNKLGIIFRYSKYSKIKSDSVIKYGNDAILDSKDIGSAYDINLRWKVLSDLAFFADYGIFLPGDAYSSEEKNRKFISAGMYLSF